MIPLGMKKWSMEKRNVIGSMSGKPLGFLRDRHEV